MGFDTAKKHLHLISPILFLLLLLPHKSVGDDMREKLEWVSADHFRNLISNDPGRFEPAGMAGNDIFVYVARTTLGNRQGQSILSFNPRENDYHYYNYLNNQVEKVHISQVQVLKHCPGALAWVRRLMDDGSAKKLPLNVVVGGFHPTSGNTLYLCRGRMNYVIYVGMYMAEENRGCHVVDSAGQQHGVRNFELATISLLAIGMECLKT